MSRSVRWLLLSSVCCACSLNENEWQEPTEKLRTVIRGKGELTLNEKILHGLNESAKWFISLNQRRTKEIGSPIAA